MKQVGEERRGEERSSIIYYYCIFHSGIFVFLLGWGKEGMKAQG
jgi:hypothetical protein